MFIGPCIIVIVEEWKTNLMSLAILFHFLCVQHVSDINISIIRRLMEILMSETCWAHKKWNKVTSDNKFVFHSSTITMMHGPINISFTFCVCQKSAYRCTYVDANRHILPCDNLKMNTPVVSLVLKHLSFPSKGVSKLDTF